MKNIFDCFALEQTEATQKYVQRAWEMYAEYKDMIFSVKSLEFFQKYQKRLLEIATELKKDEMNAVYCYFLSIVIQNESHKVIRTVCRPQKELSSELYDTLPLFSLLRLIPKMRALHEKLGVPSDITEACVDMFENQIGDFEAKNGHIGISDYVTWMTDFINGRILRIGRFNFERENVWDVRVYQRNGETVIFPNGITMHKSGMPLGSVGCTDTDGSFEAVVSDDGTFVKGYPIKNGLCDQNPVRLDLSEWKCVLDDGDPVISVHIPTGCPLDFESNTADLARAREVFTRVFGDFKAFYCASWLLDPRLEALTGKKTNLIKFADRFIRFPIKSSGKSVFSYLYNQKNVDNVENLPENTSLQRSVKKYLLNGEHIYGAQGIILF